ncbi:FliM/FliN family flagellar motor C-terminal domain-containing protein [Legionella micdadei]|uniref:Type III flagellar switch regulator (C-ring) FliN C-term n=1 Tax=Legionella micdadei TaxID=451 RepID=A0A098GGN3_LEGMI|nr:FliM/FliN family flagellar motor C-terminal domain-containing protein [Legionella micdadei]ARG96955.1 hypothetical protein B6N58_04310 [Legionella micdadei]KTD26665.1 Surface presentation of antigens (SPOA) [Legionella micdadei]NSL19470.1 FliM/FliN family flagellar motor switch protein [Legionella micdadei]CEG61638.1 protein of unknown function [Legionella micdadei]SCY47819.1 Type III flagellar switch regulator (C-ring) FliN C-term [Legionella micdadei]
MKKNAKPYRIINSIELQHLTHQFQEVLLHWNKTHFIEPIELEVSCCSEIYKFNETQLINDRNDSPIALIDQDYLPFLQKSIFGEVSYCLDQVSSEIFIRLLNDFLSMDSLQTTRNSTHYNEWIYPGSASLILTFSHNKGLFHLYLHPNWVLAHLQPQNSPTPLTGLELTLASKKLTLTIEFAAFRLPLGKLLNLQVGNIIKTDHALNKPLLVQYNNQTVCEGEIGRLLQHKSIQLTRS